MVDVIMTAFATKLSPLTEEMPDRAEEYSVSLEKGDVSVADRGIYKEFSFFFSLLKRKKEAKKEKLPPTLFLYGNVLHGWQCNCH